MVKLNESMNNLIDIFKSGNGYASLAILKAKGVHTDQIRKLLDTHIIEKIKPGLYKLANMPILAEQGMVDLSLAMNKAVICLHSALSYYGLCTSVPALIMIALPKDAKSTKVLYPPFKVFHFSGNYYFTGIRILDTPNGKIRIYDPEKTIVDCFRYRNKLGIDIALEGLSNYIKTESRDYQKLISYSQSMRMFRIMKPYLESNISQ